MLKKTLQNNRRALVLSASVIAMALIGAVLMVVFWPRTELAAEIRGKKITMEEYLVFKDKYERWANHSNEQEFGEFSTKNALDYLILEAALEDEAEKRDIEVPQEEIDRRYREIVANYESEEDFANQIDAAFDWTPELTKRNIRVELLKSKLQDHLLSLRDVWGIFVRWDANFEEGVPESEWDQRAKDKFNEEFAPLFERNAPIEEIEARLKEVNEEPAWFEPQIGITNKKRLNDTTAMTVFIDENEWEQIKNLDEVGEQTELVRSEGGYYALYRLTYLADGPHDSWDAFLESVRDEDATKTYVFEYTLQVAEYYLKYNLRDLISKTTNFLSNSAKSVVNILKGEDVYAGHTRNCSIWHFSAFFGTVRDAVTGAPINGVNVTADWNLSGPTNGTPRCHPHATYSGNTNHVGFYQVGQIRGNTNTGLECWTRWNLTFSRAGYHNVFLGNQSLENNGSAIEKSVSMAPLAYRGSIVQHKINHDTGSPGGDFSRNRVYIDGHGSSTGNPATFGNLLAGKSYTVRVDDGPNEWYMIEHRVCVDGNCSTGTGTVATASIPNKPNAVVEVWWRFRQRDWNLNVSISHNGPGAWNANGVEPETTYNIYAQVCNNGQWHSNNATLWMSVDVGSDSWLESKSPSNWSYGIGSVSIGCPIGKNFSFRISENAPNNAQICFRARVSPKHRSGGTDASNLVCTHIRIPRKPYLSIYGGDVHAGATISADAGYSCSGSAGSGTNSVILGRVLDALRGSRGQYGISATGNIEAFGSRNQPTGSSLTFGNSDSLGNLKQRVLCRPNYMSFAADDEIGSSTGSINLASLAATRPDLNGKIVRWKGGGQKELQGTLPKGYRLTLLSEGPVLVTGNITYPGGDNPIYVNRNEVPSLMVVTSGNIAIKSNVNRLTGRYVANGTISTCADSTSSGGLKSPAIYHNQSGTAICGQQLIVYGMLEATNFMFRRTYGDVRDADPNKAAELIRLSAELFLSAPPGVGTEPDDFLYRFDVDLPPLY